MAIILDLPSDVVEAIAAGQPSPEIAIKGSIAAEFYRNDTLGVLQRAAARGLVDVPSVITAIRASGFYAPETLLRSTFAEWL